MTVADDWLSVPEAAEQLGIARRAVLFRIRSGALPAVRIGRVFAIRQSDVDAAPARYGRRAS